MTGGQQGSLLGRGNSNLAVVWPAGGKCVSGTRGGGHYRAWYGSSEGTVAQMGQGVQAGEFSGDAGQDVTRSNRSWGRAEGRD